MEYQIDRFLTIIFQSLFGSILPWIEYSNQSMSFTLCNSPSKWLQKNVEIDYNKNEFSVEKHFFDVYLTNWLNWLQLKRCRTSTIEPGHKTKFKLLWKMCETPFYVGNIREKIIYDFMKFQKTYRALNRLAFLWKFKRAHMSVTTDLYFVDIDPQKDSTFVLYQNNTKFSFKITELLRIIEAALCHHFEDNFEIMSQNPTNPYNKVKLEYHNLCNIYHHMLLYTKMNIPIFFQLWYREKFNIIVFSQKNELLLKELCVKNFTSSLDVKSNYVYRTARDMISENRFTSNWNIHSKISNEDVVRKVRHCLFEYYMINLQIDIPLDMLTYYEKELHQKLKKKYFQDRHFGCFHKKVDTKSSNIFHDTSTKFTFDPTRIPEEPPPTYIFGSLSNTAAAANTSGNVHPQNHKIKTKKRRRATHNRQNHRRNVSSIPNLLSNNMYTAFNLLEDKPFTLNNSCFNMKEHYESIIDDEGFSRGRDQEDNNELYSLRATYRRINDTLPESHRLPLYTQTRDIEQILLVNAAEALLAFNSTNRMMVLRQRIQLERETDEEDAPLRTGPDVLETIEEILPSIASLFSNE